MEHYEKSNESILEDIIKQNKIDSSVNSTEMKIISKWKVVKYNTMTMVLEASDKIHNMIF